MSIDDSLRDVVPAATRSWVSLGFRVMGKAMFTLKASGPRDNILYWFAAEVLNLGYDIRETLLSAIYTHYGNLIQVTSTLERGTDFFRCTLLLQKGTGGPCRARPKYLCLWVNEMMGRCVWI